MKSALTEFKVGVWPTNFRDSILRHIRTDTLPTKHPMALISGFTIIRMISLFHLTAAYFFLVNPHVIADQNIVFILGEAIRVVRERSHGYGAGKLTYT